MIGVEKRKWVKCDYVNPLLFGEREESTWLPYAIAAGCMSNNHLWQDMGLASRIALSDLIKQNFPTLYEKKYRQHEVEKILL